jgi:hypothetical protein
MESNAENAILCIFYPSIITVSVAGPDQGFGSFLTPGSGLGIKSASGSGICDEQPGSYFLELKPFFFVCFLVKILKFFYTDPGSGMETVRIRDGKKSDPG